MGKAPEREIVALCSSTPGEATQVTSREKECEGLKMTPLNKYRTHLTALSTELAALEKRINTTTLFRLSTFLLAAFLFYFGIKKDESYFTITAFFLLAVFLFFVVRHLRLKEKKEHQLRKIKITLNEIALFEGASSFLDKGDAFLNTSAYAIDLDLFGEGSLFHRISRAYTAEGKIRLADHLIHTPLQGEAILACQQAGEELAADYAFREEYLALLLALPSEENPCAQLDQWSEQKARFSGKTFISILRYGFPLFGLVLWIFAFYNGNYDPALWFSGLNLAIALAFAKNIMSDHRSISGMNNQFSVYARIWEHVARPSFSAAKNREIKDQLQSASSAISDLAKLSERFDRRLNPIVFVLLNGLFLYDLHCAVDLEKWIAKHRTKMRSWFTATAEMEMLHSIGTWNYNHPDFPLPQLNSSKTIEAEEIAHPFIAASKRISNSIVVGDNEKLVLITGSNMSGKSTFLRSLGINLILAQCGMRVCAQSFRFHPAQLLTSLRQTDSLKENVSLFHAELIRLHEIQDAIRKNGFALVLIDEMLRGTNSEDKLNGSRKLIERLMEMDCIGLIATHDLALGDMENLHPGKISNACFESRIENDELIFDYRLRKGIARNKNASFLLRKMNITD